MRMKALNIIYLSRKKRFKCPARNKSSPTERACSPIVSGCSISIFTLFIREPLECLFDNQAFVDFLPPQYLAFKRHLCQFKGLNGAVNIPQKDWLLGSRSVLSPKCISSGCFVLWVENNLSHSVKTSAKLASVSV
jgi:hypothetical protein